MRIPLFKRITICLFNIFFPPLAVMLITGPTSPDTFLNACLFLLAVIPSHIHGFYVSAVYFQRKRRVRRGKYPGKSHKAGIWSERVLTGGAGWEGAEALKGGNKRSKRKSGVGNAQEWDDDVGSDYDHGRRVSKRYSTRETQKLKRRSTGRSGYVSASGLEGQATGYGYTDAQMREAQNVARVGSQVSRTSRRF